MELTKRELKTKIAVFAISEAKLTEDYLNEWDLEKCAILQGAIESVRRQKEIAEARLKSYAV